MRSWGRGDHPIHHLKTVLEKGYRGLSRTVSSSEEKEGNSKESLNAEDDDGEGKSTGGDFKTDLAVSAGPVEGSHGPCDTDTEENVDSVGASDVSDRGISSIVTDGCGFRGKSI